MRLLHTGDLHIGKRLGECSLLEDQHHILQEIRRLAQTHQVDALVIAGDVYDKTLPPAEAVTLLDDFLTGLHQDGIPVLLISGNHDSPERLGFGARLLSGGGIYIATELTAEPRPLEFQDAWGRVQVWLLPFVRPATARAVLGQENLATYDQAVRAMVGQMPIDPCCRQVLVAHQFVTAQGIAPQSCDSEQISVGGIDQVEVSTFAAFDYVALGHLHGPQWVGRETVRYAGSPLQYSFSEAVHQKSVALVELASPGQTSVELLSLSPLRRVRQIRGRLAQLLAAEVVAAAPAEDYIRAVLTDEEDLIRPMDQLRRVYPNLLQLAVENRRSGPGLAADAAPQEPEKTPLEHFQDFYTQQQGIPPAPEKLNLVEKLLEQIWEEQA